MIGSGCRGINFPLGRGQRLAPRKVRGHVGLRKEEVQRGCVIIVSAVPESNYSL